jgi:hypothetical protein
VDPSLSNGEAAALLEAALRSLADEPTPSPLSRVRERGWG